MQNYSWEVELKKYLPKYSLLQWIRILDKMREDRSNFFCPDQEFSKLETLLEIENGTPEFDRSRIFKNTYLEDINRWYKKYIPLIPVDASSPVQRMEGETFGEKYPAIHGKKEIPQCQQKKDADNTMQRHGLWGKILKEIIAGYHEFNGRILYDSGNLAIKGKYCINHQGVTPLEWIDIDTKDNTFGSYQTVYRDGTASRTYATQAQIVDFTPPFDSKYYIALIGNVPSIYQFDGMGFAEYQDALNVLFEDGPIEGKYTSPLIGPGTVWTSPNPEDFANNPDSIGISGCYISSARLLVTPADGFRDYYIPDGENQQS